MRLVTFSHHDSTRIGALNDGGIVDLTATELPSTMIELLASGAESMERAREAARNGERMVSSKDPQILAPVPRPGKVLAIGLNYRDHAEESGQPIPPRPVVFSKMPTCIVGPNHPIYIPRVSRAVDWEAELCLVIGKRARYVAAADAPAYIAGYCAGNDVSVRDWQFHSPTWVMGKSFDTHGPIGPWLVTGDEIDPSNLGIRLLVNGEVKQSSNTSQLIFGAGEIIEYLSAGFTLEPGDIVFTGTPAGVGATRRPPEFLKAGDTVRVEIDGLGVLENPVMDESA
jgi:2-keto-4-pentenoate hydratase/2-oxohepta-3-ene-1,7-dioic acid hydratase in catechol pathway